MVGKDPWRWRCPAYFSSFRHTLILPQINTVKHTRVIAFPPLALPIFLGKTAIIRHPLIRSLRIGPKGSLPPPPSVLVMKSNAKTHSLCPTGLGPFAQ